MLHVRSECQTVKKTGLCYAEDRSVTVKHDTIFFTSFPSTNLKKYSTADWLKKEEYNKYPTKIMTEVLWNVRHLKISHEYKN
jgi:hypothetical protein